MSAAARVRASAWIMGLLSGLVAVASLAITAGPSSEELAPVPVSDGWVTDTAHVLADGDRQSLAALLADYQRETHHAIVVLTVETLGDETLEAYSLRVANAWRVGLKGWNNGILVTLALQERRIRIELGTGMEAYISDADAKRVIDGAMLPAFRRGDFAGGLRAGLGQLMALARRYRITDPDRPPHA